MPVKTMFLFATDNPDVLPGAELIGNVLVSKPAPDRYPTLIPIGSATIDGFDGLLVMEAGNNGTILVHLFEGKTPQDWPEIRKTLATKPSAWPEWIHQYRISVHGLLNLIASIHEKAVFSQRDDG